MKRLFIYLFIYLFTIACNAQEKDSLKINTQQKEYSKINFKISDFEWSIKLNITYVGTFIEVQDNYYKEKGFLRLFFLPKNKTEYKNYVSNTDTPLKQIKDSIYNILSSKKALDYFEIYAYWVEKKYLKVMKEGGEDGKMYDVWYVPEGKLVNYNIYKLTNRGWELIVRQKQTKEELYLIFYVLPYVSDAIIPDGWKRNNNK